MDKRIIMLVIVIALLSANVMALGLTPAKTTIDFKPNSKHTVTYTVINDEQKEMRLMIYAEGGLNGSLLLHDELVEFKAGESSKSFTYDVVLPERMEPGQGIGSVVIREIPDGKSRKQNRIKANVGLITKVVVNVPYPGKYMKVEELEVSEAQKGEQVSFIVPITNLGTDRLFSIKATIDILGPTNERIATVSSGSITLDPQKRQLLKADWVADVNPGTYHAVATIAYEGGMEKAEKNFNVGIMNIEVIKVETKNFKLGGIAKMDITLRSEWNDIIKNLYGTLLIKDSNFDSVAEVKTAPIDLVPYSSQDIEAFWDTTGMKEGTYYMTLKLHVADFIIEKQFESYVGMDTFRTSMLSATGDVISSKGSNRNAMLSVAIIVLIMLNVFWIYYFKRRLDRKQGLRPPNGLPEGNLAEKAGA